LLWGRGGGGCGGGGGGGGRGPPVGGGGGGFPLGAPHRPTVQKGLGTGSRGRGRASAWLFCLASCGRLRDGGSRGRPRWGSDDGLATASCQPSTCKLVRADTIVNGNGAEPLPNSTISSCQRHTVWSAEPCGRRCPHFSACAGVGTSALRSLAFKLSLRTLPDASRGRASRLPSAAALATRVSSILCQESCR